MTVVLNEIALRALLEAQAGPVMQNIERRAEAATAALNERIEGIIANPLARPRAGYRMTDEGAVVGIPFEGSVSEYLGEKLSVRENWWIAFGQEIARNG